MSPGVLMRLRGIAGKLDDAANGSLKGLLENADAVGRAIDKTALGDLEAAIPRLRDALVAQDVALGGAVSGTITDLLAASDRTLGRLTADE
jgi:hypothetical protein